MSSISGITNRIVETGLKKPINYLSKNKLVSKMCDDFRSGDPKRYAKWGIYSIVLKDGLGGYMYVTQSLNNKDIPEEKRKFVAALDLTNCGLMIAMQLLMAKTISSKAIQTKMFEKTFGKLFDTKAGKACQELIKKKPEFAKLSEKQFAETFGKFKKDVTGFFGVITTLVASTILAKRVVVPFLATPLADKAKAMMDKKGQKDKTNNA